MHRRRPTHSKYLGALTRRDVDVEMPARARHAHARRVDAVAVVAIQQACRRTDAFVLEHRQQLLDVIRREKAVGVHEEHELAAHDLQRLIHRRAEAAVGVVANHALEERRGCIRGGVVDGDHFEVAMRLRADAFETARQVSRAVPGYDDDGDESHLSNAFLITIRYARSASPRVIPFGSMPTAAAMHRIIMPPMIVQRSASASPDRSHLRA